MINKVLKYINENNLLPNKSKVLVALSGGMDSMALLFVLKELGYEVIIAHVNHKKREASELEEKEIISLANNLNIKYHVYHLEKLDGNFQSEAHDKRYKFFIDIAIKENIKYIATAHHQDDNLETILLNLISGSNLYGYSGISKNLLINNINIIRPFLCINKNDILNYITKNNIKYYEDQSNFTMDYTRNRIRHNVIPKLKEESNSILDKASSYSNQLKEAFNYIRGISLNYLKNSCNNIIVSTFNNLDICIKKDIICLLLETYNIQRSENLINDILSIILNNKPQATYNLKDNYIFKKRYDKCYIDKENNKFKFNYILKDENSSINDKFINIYFTRTIPKQCTNYLKLCYNNIEFPLIVRNRIDGDKIFMSYGHKKVKDIFIDKKIPLEKRNKIPVILDSNNNILSILNIAKSKIFLEKHKKDDIYLIVEVQDE